MANWLRTVSNTNGKYCVDIMVDGSFQRVSQWYDTLEEATGIAQAFIASKAASTSESASNAANDVLEKTEEDVFAEE